MKLDDLQPVIQQMKNNQHQLETLQPTTIVHHNNISVWTLLLYVILISGLFYELCKIVAKRLRKQTENSVNNTNNPVDIDSVRIN